MTVLVRHANVEDAEGIFTAHRRAIFEVCSKDYTLEEVTGWFPENRKIQNYVDRILAHNKTYLVAEIDGLVAGFLNFEGNEINACYVNPDYIGSGLGRRLFLAAEDIIKNSGHTKIILNSSVTALKFYEKMGLKTLKKIRHRLNSGIEIDAYEMEKNI